MADRVEACHGTHSLSLLRHKWYSVDSDIQSLSPANPFSRAAAAPPLLLSTSAGFRRLLFRASQPSIGRLQKWLAPSQRRVSPLTRHLRQSQRGQREKMDKAGHVVCPRNTPPDTNRLRHICCLAQKKKCPLQKEKERIASSRSVSPRARMTSIDCPPSLQSRAHRLNVQLAISQSRQGLPIAHHPLLAISILARLLASNHLASWPLLLYIDSEKGIRELIQGTQKSLHLLRARAQRRNNALTPARQP